MAEEPPAVAAPAAAAPRRGNLQMRSWDGINYPFRHFRTELHIQLAFQEIPAGRQLYALGPVLDGAARAIYLRYISGGGEISLDGFLAIARELFHSEQESLRIRMEISKLRVRGTTGTDIMEYFQKFMTLAVNLDPQPAEAEQLFLFIEGFSNHLELKEKILEERPDTTVEALQIAQ